MAVHRTGVVQVGRGEDEGELLRIERRAPVAVAPALRTWHAALVEAELGREPGVTRRKAALRVLHFVGFLGLGEKSAQRAVEFRLWVVLAVGHVVKVPAVDQAVHARRDQVGNVVHELAPFGALRKVRLASAPDQLERIACVSTLRRRGKKDEKEKKTLWPAPQGPMLRMQLGLALERDRVAREFRVTHQDFAQRCDDLLCLGVVPREDALHVVARDAVERRAVRRLDAEQMRERVERFAAADRHVAGQGFLVAVDEHRGLPGRAHRAVLRAARRAARDTEGLVAEGAVRRRAENLRRQAGLAIEHLGAPTARTDVVLLRDGDRREQRGDSSDCYELLHFLSLPLFWRSGGRNGKSFLAARATAVKARTISWCLSAVFVLRPRYFGFL